MWDFPTITLASESPRRKDILTQLQIPYHALASHIDEYCTIENPAEKVMFLAQKKAKAIRPKAPTDIIIAADTIVALPNSYTPYALHKPIPNNTTYNIFEKPQSPQHAQDMLLQLSNVIHFVFTGICISDNNNHYINKYEHTAVQFIDIENILLERYIQTNEWQGVAGGYRIQGCGAYFLKAIHGNYSNVMGLSIPLTIEMLSSII